MAKIIHIYGEVRSAEVAKKAATGEVYGTRFSILSEPEGDTIDLLAFARVIDPEILIALKRVSVHAVAELEAVSGQRGGAFINLSLRAIERMDGQPLVASGDSEPKLEAVGS